MSKQSPDFSFERDGRPFSAWLGRLVAEDAPTRLAAGEALQAMLWGLPSYHTDLCDIDWKSSQDRAAQSDRFKEAVRAAVRAPNFPSLEFVRRLIRHRIANSQDWQRRVDEVGCEDETPSVYEERLVRRINDPKDDAERTEAIRRYGKWLCAKANRDSRRSEAIFAGAESLSAGSAMASVVFQSLGATLLVDRPGLWAMLHDKTLFNNAARTLAEIGPAALDFAGLFIEGLDATEEPYRFQCAHALGSIGRNDPAVIDELLRRLRSGPDSARVVAAAALEQSGPPLAGRLEIALDFLLGATHSPSLVWAATPALASIGRDREEALQRVLELARPRPPRWRTYESHSDYRFGEVMHERGVAIQSLSRFRRFAERVTPTLIDAFDSFEEYDPDWSYGGEHERVCFALRAFGAEAAPAVPRLARYLDEWRDRPEEDREWPKAVFGLLAAIGPPASKALPALERLRARQADSVEAPEAALDPDDPLDQTILAL
jgi:hypothetical protein